MLVLVCDPSRLGRLPKSSPEDLNIVAMDERMREMEKKMNLFETKVAMNESLTDRIDIRVNSLQVSVEDHERVITNQNIRQSAAVSSKRKKAASKTKGAAHQTPAQPAGQPAAEPTQTPPECLKKTVTVTKL